MIVYIKLTGIVALFLSFSTSCAQHRPSNVIAVKATDDFDVTGNGSNSAWNTTSWHSLTLSGEADKRQTRIKTLYSDTGIYFLFHNEDHELSATKMADFERLWLEDVVEVFLWPDTTQTIYFEYEISPLDYELPIIIPNINGKFLGWLPWEYTGGRKTRHRTYIEGGEKKPGSAIQAWYAEIFIPYALLSPLQNVPPRKGTKWRSNMYRNDFDGGKRVSWSWQKTDSNYHQYSKFGTLVFD